ncbi:myo-inositol-1(or 4)-monophosphatase [Sporothrix schenckii 1099-18]|uniref:Inositol-1-monophosphatase n=1 Tax=Sporothrix schenckii 1099-18 TaxID=1397361 RepID=A0A0F2MCE8_SPOSC|nr:myo-inositol-1(or 4)-monophosphatase [Sporothrix schenckii 1099-18]KJR85836.1 myo-inositol-1(or 4)-monophosphatase [Sporothrix schenckii 1099-18]
MADIDLQAVHDTLVSVAFEAGRMILAADPNNIPKGTKKNSVDLVTEADQAVERMVYARLRADYPTCEFVGEETYVAGETRVTDAPTFIVDPIDGTTNFVHGFPHACISLGFAVGRRPVVGVVYNPFLDVLYTGIKGKGSFMERNASLSRNAPGPDGSNGSTVASQKLRLPLVGRGDVQEAPELSGLGSALVAIEWGSDRQGANFDLKVGVFQRLAAAKEEAAKEGAIGKNAMVHSLRSLGSAALNFCAVAAGQLDCYWEGGCYAWDVCAGWCILSEAGGFVASGNPGDWEPALDSRLYLAVRGAPSGGRELVEEFWSVIGDAGTMIYVH